MTSTRGRLIAAMLAGSALPAGPAWAQAAEDRRQAGPTTDPAEQAATNPADIVVTAQKREERLQDVPIAVSVVSGAAIEQQGRINLEGAQYLVPTLNFAKSGSLFL